MTSFVDHMKNITVPSMVQDINEINHYWAMLTRIPGSGVSAQPNMDVVTTSQAEKLFPLDNGWYLRRETPVKGFTKKWPDPIHGPNELHIDGLEDMLQLLKDANDTATKRTLLKKIDAAKEKLDKKEARKKKRAVRKARKINKPVPKNQHTLAQFFKAGEL